MQFVFKERYFFCRGKYIFSKGKGNFFSKHFFSNGKLIFSRVLILSYVVGPMEGRWAPNQRAPAKALCYNNHYTAQEKGTNILKKCGPPIWVRGPPHMLGGPWGGRRPPHPE